jgi:ESS family glutamate:Na+ symporter
MKLGVIETAAAASLLLLAGYAIRRIIKPLERVNMPAPVIGGLLAAVAMLIVRILELPAIEFDTSPQQPLMIAFFTSLGFAASVRLLRAGGLQVLVLLALCSVFAVLQNLLGIAIATAFGLNPLFGVITGSVTLTGGPATGLAFAPLFEQAGVAGAATVAITTAMAGIILGSVVGAPLATWLIERRGLRSSTASRASIGPADTESHSEPRDEATRVLTVLKTIAIFLIAMWLGSWISAAIQRTGLTMPAYIGAMLAASALRNLDDVTGWLKLPHKYIDIAGAVTLSLFLVMAMMTLDLLKLSSLALPLLVGIVAQLLLVMAAFIWPLYQWMGRDYDAAVISGGFAGFMLGTTANAMAVMRSLVERYSWTPSSSATAPSSPTAAPSCRPPFT